MGKARFISGSRDVFPPSPVPHHPVVDPRLSRPRDRRRTRRIKDPVLIFLYQDRHHEKAARPLDLSPEGIGIETTGPLKAHGHLQMAIIIGECQINALGTVVYTKRQKSGKFRSGIKFEHISDRNKGIIQLYLERTQDPKRRGGDEQYPEDRSKGTQTP